VKKATETKSKRSERKEAIKLRLKLNPVIGGEEAPKDNARWPTTQLQPKWV